MTEITGNDIKAIYLFIFYLYIHGSIDESPFLQMVSTMIVP